MLNHDMPSEIQVDPRVFDDPKAFIDEVKAGISGTVVREAVKWIGSRSLFVDILHTSAANLSRVYKRKHLSREDSEKVLDTLRVYERALRVWESEVAAREWLHTPVTALDGEKPIDLLGTFEGRKWVRQTLRKIETGDFS